MTLAEFLNRDLHLQVAELWDNEISARTALGRIGYPRARIPQWHGQSPLEWWTPIFEQLADGIRGVPGGLDDLLAEAARLYRGLAVFAPYDREGGCPAAPAAAAVPGQQVPAAAQVVDRSVRGVRRRLPPLFLRVVGDELPADLTDRLRTVARVLGESRAIFEESVYSAGLVVYTVRNATMEQLRRVADRLEHDAGSGGYPLRTTCADRTFSEYLLSRLYVSGPDARRFELQNVPSSTTPSELGGQIVRAHYAQLFAAEPGGRPRQSVMDLQNEDGTSVRMAPDRSLAEQGVPDGAHLALSPESRAAVHPQRRDEAIIRARNSLRAFESGHPQFQAILFPPDYPTEITLRFIAPGFSVTRDDPTVRDRDYHEVLLKLPEEFPDEAPIVSWQTPIFHPNIRAEDGLVCLGELRDSYRAGMDLGDLCQMLIDIARYRNYCVEPVRHLPGNRTEGGALNFEAVRWTTSAEGQARIEQRGGWTLLQMFLEAHHDPGPLTFRIRERTK